VKAIAVVNLMNPLFKHSSDNQNSKSAQSAGVARLCLAAIIALGLSSLVGCGQSAPPRFHSNLVQMAWNKVSDKHQQEIANVLEAMYGTPNDPYVLPETGLDLQKLQIAAGPVKGYAQGLFRLHCVHCHGITGDGMGPTAAFLKPYPRDYREGLFKFKSTPSNQPPTHDDLVRTITEGIPGTAMPSFKLLAPAEIDVLVEYVEYLSLRGQTELALIEATKELKEKESLDTKRSFLVDEVLTGDSGLVPRWKAAAEQVTQVPKPPENFGTAESIARGKWVFYNTGNCVKCHGPTALGDGQLVFDEWNKTIDDYTKKAADQQVRLSDNKDLTSEERSKKQADISNLVYALHVDALPPVESSPRNLRQGIFRGGRKPYELFYRLNNGINPSNMPGIGVTPGMTPDDIWHVVDFILDLPYQSGSQYYHSEQHMTAPPRERL
jgi:mono/diheme cytochrome c family protein